MNKSVKPKQSLFNREIAKIQRYLRTDKRHGGSYLEPPFIIELGGTPDSGKSLCIEKLYQFFHRNGFSVATPQEGAQNTQHISRKTPLYNYRTAVYTLNILLDEVNSHTHDIVIFDRGILDIPRWMLYWKEKGMISVEEYRAANTFFLSPFWTKHITASYYFVADPEVAVARDLQFASTTILGDSSNLESIRKGVEYYKALYGELKPRFPQLELIDTTHLSIQAMVDMMTEKVLGAIEKQIAERRQRA